MFFMLSPAPTHVCSLFVSVNWSSMREMGEGEVDEVGKREREEGRKEGRREGRKEGE